MNDAELPLPAELAHARERFLDLCAALRPELHRYAARLTGSVVEGEDVVQDTFAKAFYAVSLAPSLPPLRPWLFRIAHNAAIDHLKRHDRRHVEPRAEMDDLAGVDERVDPFVVRAALSHFLELPLSQRSAVILKDVLGCSLDEAAETMGATVPAVKAALVRGRARLREAPGDDAPTAPPGRGPDRAALDAYASRFNARDWDGVRALVGEDCRLDLVGKATRRGKEVGGYFARYQGEPEVRLAVVSLEGREALGVFLGEAATRPAYFVLLTWEAGRVSTIRDYRYARYVADEAEVRDAGPPSSALEQPHPR
jgi:RNA polymerase sigma-70 factor, ECF subfamily